MTTGHDKHRPFGILVDLANGRTVAGQISLRGRRLVRNTAHLYDTESFSVPGGSSLYGASKDGRVSLLDCHVHRRTDTRRSDSAFFHRDLSFRYALFGTHHLHPEDKTIHSIQFTFAEIDAILSNRGFDAFGQMLDPHADVLAAIERNSPEHRRPIFRNDGSPMVAYFTGKHELLPKTDTVLGTISAARTLRIDHRSSTMEEAPYMAIDFDDDPTTLEDAFEKMRMVRQFCAWIIGCVPEWKDVRVFTSKVTDEGYRMCDHGYPDTGLQVFGPMERTGGDSEGSDWLHTLIDAAADPDDFVRVMKNWLERNGDTERQRANTRFFGSLPGMSKKTIEDGICSAANTFDLLPSSDKPETPPISEDIKTILQQAGNRIKKIPGLDPAEREEVLDQLGGIRAYVRLRHVIEPRARLVIDVVGEPTLPDMDKVIREAVLCRNHFTHGTGDGGLRSADVASPLVALFLTRTLRFIYAASELLSCGWDLGGWLGSVRTEHLFGSYLSEYRVQIERIGLRAG